MPDSPDAGHLAQLLTQYIRQHPDRPMKSRALARALNIPPAGYAEFRGVVRTLLADGALALGRGRALTIPESTGLVTGVVRLTRRGLGFLRVPDQPDDLLVPRGRLRGALDGDTVTARVVTSRRREQRPTAEIVRVVRRADLRWMGLLERSGPGWTVQPWSKKGAPLLRIESAAGARPGELVLARPLAPLTEPSREVAGEIIQRLGPPDDALAVARGVIGRLGLRHEFPPQVIQEAEQAAAALTDAGGQDREDLREALTLTIDPHDARDFDDAISLTRASDGQVELGVHIADVAHFALEGSAIDAEAALRGTSVYLPGYCVPMLPEALSNGACSLRPNEDRLTKSVFIRYDGGGRRVSSRMASSLIRSDARLTYEQASSALDGAASTLPTNVVALLRNAARLARRIQRRRLTDGMLRLDTLEPHFELENGRVVDLRPADTSFSHTLIEMFMVEANEVVSEALTHAGIPHLRRVHPEPEPDALRELGTLVRQLGLAAPRRLDRAAIGELLEQVRGRPEALGLSYVLLRSLPQAVYSPATPGHFALASAHYCHFTSPIRRYPDLLAHRALNGLLSRDGGRRRTASKRAAREASEPVAPAQDLRELGARCSEAERRAQQAEREAAATLTLTFMAGQIGSVLEGFVTGISRYGAWAQVLPYLADGFIHRDDLPGRGWRVDPGAPRLVGDRGAITPGQRVRVRVLEADRPRQELRLALTNELADD